MVDTATPLFLDDVWTIFHHNVDDVWTTESYHRLAGVGDVDEFWAVSHAVTPYLNANMFFVMREHVFPCWDDPCNIDGGCVSVRVSIDDARDYWEAICARCLCERLVPSGEANAVNGISSSPKGKWCVFKVWLARQTEVALPSGYVGTCMYRSNRTSMTENTQRHLAAVT